jgi:alkanesulfonate monooxygenase SsuD/methylene tetrahydromethanopterin reductase-like flavin-dependent oxidoreductase (luciferase family)
VPIYLAALTSHNIELAGEIADGVMPVWWSVERVARSRRWVDRGRAKSGGRGKLAMTLGLPTFVGDDIDALRGAARANLGFFTALPFFQRLLRASGFSKEAERAEQGAPVIEFGLSGTPRRACPETMNTRASSMLDVPCS